MVFLGGAGPARCWRWCWPPAVVATATGAGEGAIVARLLGFVLEVNVGTKLKFVRTFCDFLDRDPSFVFNFLKMFKAGPHCNDLDLLRTAMIIHAFDLDVDPTPTLDDDLSCHGTDTSFIA